MCAFNNYNYIINKKGESEPLRLSILSLFPVIFHDNILCTDSRENYNLLKCPRAHGSYIADNLVTEDFKST